MRLGLRHGVARSFAESKDNAIIVDSIVPLLSLRRAKRFHRCAVGTSSWRRAVICGEQKRFYCCAVGTSSWRRAVICGEQEQFHYCIVPVTKISRNSKRNLVLLSTHAFSPAGYSHSASTCRLKPRSCASTAELALDGGGARSARGWSEGRTQFGYKVIFLVKCMHAIIGHAVIGHCRT